MAIFKAVTRRDGSAVGKNSPKRLEDYLKYETDERGRILYDADGSARKRDTTVSAHNADAEDFTFSCREIFASFDVNRDPNSVRYKHYVQGFSPEDSSRMSREECHMLGVQLTRTVWKDFPVLIVSHFDQETDGISRWHNHFLVGNCNVRTGRKLDTSASMLRAQKRFVAAQADTYGLARKGLILEDGRLLESRSGNRINSSERHLSERLRRQAEGKTAQQLREMNTLTQKAELRFAIRIALQQTNSYDSFCDYLRDIYDIRVKETRGAISFLHPDRAESGARAGGWIRGRTLGTNYEKEMIIRALEEPTNRQELGRGNDAAERPGDGVLPGDGDLTEKLIRLEQLYAEIYPELRGHTEAAVRAAGRAAEELQTTGGRHGAAL